MKRAAEIPPIPSDGQAKRVIPLVTWDQFHPWPSAAALRWYVFNARGNGAAAWIRRVGRRVLIDEAAFFAWVDKQNVGRAS